MTATHDSVRVGRWVERLRRMRLVLVAAANALARRWMLDANAPQLLKSALQGHFDPAGSQAVQTLLADVAPPGVTAVHARNWRTDTFAQPGRAHGAQTSTMACPNVTTAALADGLLKRCLTHEGACRFRRFDGGQQG